MNIPSLNSWHSLVVKLDRAKSLVSMTLDNVNYSETSEARSYSSQYSYSTSTVEFLGDLSLDGDLIFGARSNTMDLKFSGSIDDIRIYNRALSAEEIQLLYKAEAELPEQSVTSAKLSPELSDLIDGNGSLEQALPAGTVIARKPAKHCRPATPFSTQ